MSIEAGAISAIRTKLYALGIPTAAFIDDHVGNLAFFLLTLMRKVKELKDEPAVTQDDVISELIRLHDEIALKMADTVAENIAAGRVPKELLDD